MADDQFNLKSWIDDAVDYAQTRYNEAVTSGIDEDVQNRHAELQDAEKARDAITGFDAKRESAEQRISEKSAAFGIACTCAWTEIQQALVKDGTLAAEVAKCGPAMRKWVVELVAREFQVTEGADQIRWNLVRDKFNNMKTSESERFLALLGFNSDSACDDLNNIVDNAKSQ